MRKIASLLLALVMVFSLTATAFAAEAQNLGSTLATGSITITNNSTTGATVDGRTFMALKTLNATKSGNAIAYFIPAGMEVFYKTYFNITDADVAASPLTLDEMVSEKINAMGDNSLELFKFGEAVYNWVQTDAGKAAGLLTEYAIGGQVKAGEAQFTNLPLGYYVVVDITTPSQDIPTLSAVIIQTAGENVIVAVKTDPPKIEKGIDPDNDTDPATTGDGDKDNLSSKEIIPYNNTSIGDVVPYAVVTDIPNMTPFDAYVYNVKDIMSKGLTYNDDMKIVITNKDVKDANDTLVTVELIEGEHYEVTVTPNTATGETEIFVKFLNFHKWHKDWMPHSTAGDYWLMTDGSYTNKAPDSTAAQDEPTYVEPHQRFLNTDGYMGYEVVLTYSATINENAIIGIEGNPNAVTLEYTNNNSDDDGPQTSVTEKEETRTFTTGVQLTKVDPEGNTLTGAKFNIKGIRVNTTLVSGTEYLPTAPAYIAAGTTTYYKLISGRYTETPATEDTISIYSTDVWYELKTNPVSYTQTSPENLSAAEKQVYADPTGATKINTYTLHEYTDRAITDTATVDAEAFVDSNGVLTFKGLGAGDYTITELVSPGGYNALRYPINVRIRFTAPNGTNPAKWEGEYKLSNEDGAQWNTVTWNDETGIMSFEVENRTGTELPVTGGMGTTLFYVFGSIMMIGAAVLLVTKKRMAN